MVCVEWGTVSLPRSILLSSIRATLGFVVGVALVTHRQKRLPLYRAICFTFCLPDGFSIYIALLRLFLFSSASHIFSIFVSWGVLNGFQHFPFQTPLLQHEVDRLHVHSFPLALALSHFGKSRATVSGILSPCCLVITEYRIIPPYLQQDRIEELSSRGISCDNS